MHEPRTLGQCSLDLRQKAMQKITIVDFHNLPEFHLLKTSLDNKI